MKRFYYALLMAGMVLAAQKSSAQGDLNIFGYFQGTFVHSAPAETGSGEKYNSFSVQQLNLFLNKDLSDEFSAFANLEITNSFSSERHWGAFNLEEAWMKYSPNDAFNLKAGLLIPKFNNLNEIKNRTPLLPYIIRPLVYEASISTLVNIEDFVPQRAYIQAYGFLPVGDTKIEYAAYAGNSGKSYINTRGSDTTTFKMVGGRLGFTVGDLKVGVSSTYDRESHKDTSGVNKFLVLGDVPRIRIGGDLSYSVAGFTLEGEVIMVRYTLTDDNQKKLDAANQNPFIKAFVGPSLDKTFYYGNLTYNITSDLYVYAGYSYLENQSSGFWKSGFSGLTGGAGYRPVDNVVVKAQYAKFKVGDNDLAKYHTDNLYTAVSVFF